jgi:HSP20 family protein
MAKQKTHTQTKETRNPKTADPTETVSELGTRLATTPFALMKRFGEEMDRLFGDFDFSRLNPSAALDLSKGIWSPQVEMFERDGQLVVRADLPGLTKNDVNVEINDNGLTIEGERQGETVEKREGFYRSERKYGKFYRRLTLPEGIKIEDANATFNNGVLEITMEAPKRTETKTRRLQIREESRPHAKGKAA